VRSKVIGFDRPLVFNEVLEINHFSGGELKTLRIIHMVS
jgi:hypothetical protein